MTAVDSSPVVLITGGARRIGATLCRRFHARGYRVVIHYRNSETEAEQLADALNSQRANSAALVCANLCSAEGAEALARKALDVWRRLDLLINNASTFYPTPLGSTNRHQWQELLDSNLSGPFFLAQALAPELNRRNGAIINLLDVHGQTPLKGYGAYSIAKAGAMMMTQVLAKELAPHVRVNGIAPGPILPPEGEAERSAEQQQQLLDSTLLKRFGTPDAIADAALFLARQDYVTGQILAVDGGKSLYS